MSEASRSRFTLAATAVLALTLVGLVNFLSSQHYRRWDWTSDKLFTLSDRSKQVLRELDKDIQVYVFLARGEQDFADIETLLEEYEAITSRISVEWVDPDRDRARYQLLADKFGVDTLLAGELTLSQVPVVVTSGDRKWKVERNELIVEDFESFDDVDGHKLDLQSERAITGAILEVTTGEPTRICLSKGHGEWELGAYGDRSFDAVARELEWEKIEIQPFELTRDQEVPRSCDALFVVSPERLFTPEEVAVVDRFLDSGGNVLLALDPLVKKEALQPTGFEPSLANRGIILGSDLVIENEESRRLPGNLGDLFLTIDLGTHRLTDTIRKRGGGILIAVARSVDAAPKSHAEVIMRTSPKAVAEHDLQRAFEEKGRAGVDARVVPLAVAWEFVPPLGDDLQPVESDGPEPGRLLVVGDSDWMSGELLDNPQLSNIDLLSSTAGWLTKREALINIAPRKAKARAVIMSDADLQNLFFRVVVLLPLASLIAGFGVWWTRRT